MEINRINLFKGQIIELKVQEEFLRYGFDISIPTYNSARYDLIVDTGIEILKIQTKKAIQNSELSFTFSCTTQNNMKSSNHSHHKYTKDEIDYFATVWNDKVYLVPVDETSNQKTIQIQDTQYLAENILNSYYRISDAELYNKSSSYKGQREDFKCIECGTPISQKDKLCPACYHKKQRTVERPSREILKQLIREKPFTEIGRMFKVTDNAIRKWCDSYSLPRKKTEINQYSQEEWDLL